MSLQNSPLKLKLPKRQKLDLSLEKCSTCQNHKTDNLSLAKEESIKTFIAALEKMMFLKEYRPILVQTSMKYLNKKLNGTDPVMVRI